MIMCVRVHVVRSGEKPKSFKGSKKSTGEEMKIGTFSSCLVWFSVPPHRHNLGNAVAGSHSEGNTAAPVQTTRSCSTNQWQSVWRVCACE